MEQRYYKASDVAEKFGVHRQTIRNWIDKGLLRALKLDGCHYIMTDSLQELESKLMTVKEVEESVVYYKERLKILEKQHKESVDKLRACCKGNQALVSNRQAVVKILPTLFSVVNNGLDLTLRGKKMIEMLLDGKDVKYISEEFGITPARVTQLIDLELRKLVRDAKNYTMLQEENKRLKKELQTMENNIKSLRNFRDTGTESIEYNKVDVQESIITHKLVDCCLSVRVLNALRSYREIVNGEWVDMPIVTVGDLTRHNKTDMLKLRNFGKKCLNELDDFLNELGLEWGTNYMVNEKGEVVKVEQK